MSRGFGDRVSVEFYKATDRRQEFTIISQMENWVSHYSPKRERSIRCGGLRCALCAAGAQKQLRVDVMMIDGRGKEWLFELRERHREVMEQFESTVGLRISIKREGTAKNSPITVKVLDQVHAIERDIARLVAHFGEAPDLVDKVRMESYPIPPGALQPIGEQLEDPYDPLADGGFVDGAAGRHFGKHFGDDDV